MTTESVRRAKWIAGALGILLAMVQGSASAQDRTSALYLGGYFAPMFTYTKLDSDWVTKDGKGGFGALGFRDNRWAFEVEGVYSKLGGRSEFRGANFSVLYFPLDGLRNLYGVAGIGGLQAAKYPGFDNNSFSNGTVEAGIGNLFPIRLSDSYEMAIRAEARYRFDRREKDISDDPALENSVDRNHGDILMSVGVQIPFGRRYSRDAFPPPETDPNVAVVPVNGPQCSDGKDNDGDGLIDMNDKGCTGPDDDDETDPPPLLTPLGATKPGDVFVLRGVNFDFNKAELTPDAVQILDGVYDQLARFPSVIVELAGHTDSIGSAEYNQQLSERRAQSVKLYLVSKGLEADRLTVVGYGETRPVSDNATEEGRAKNRRTEERVLSGTPEAAGSGTPEQ